MPLCIPRLQFHKVYIWRVWTRTFSYRSRRFRPFSSAAPCWKCLRGSAAVRALDPEQNQHRGRDPRDQKWARRQRRSPSWCFGLGFKWWEASEECDTWTRWEALAEERRTAFSASLTLSSALALIETRTYETCTCTLMENRKQLQTFS